MFHMFIGNLAIGCVEGLIVAAVFKRKKRFCIPLMIVANYFSAWAGGMPLVGYASRSLHLDLYNAWEWMWLLAGAAYLLTLILEWPFVAACLWKAKHWLIKSILACLLIQTISYLCLFGLYWSASGKSLYTQVNVVPASQMLGGDNIVLWYISAQDGDVYRMSLMDGQTESVHDLNSDNRFDRLLFQPSTSTSEEMSLAACFYRSGGDNSIRELLPTCLPVDRTSQPDPASPRAETIDSTSFNFGRAGVFPGHNTDWQAWSGFWAGRGLRVKNEQTGQSFRLAFDTPFASWSVRNATILPDDRIIFQLGEDQICILDPATRNVARIARGRGPTVSLQP